MSTELIKRAAIHEAGHVVMAYFNRYRCNFTDCSAAKPGEGKTEISWAPIHTYVNMILNYQSFKTEIAESAKKGGPDLNSWLEEFLKQFLLVLCSGTAAEIIYDKKNSRTPTNTINGADSDTIATFLDGIVFFDIVADQKDVQQAFDVSVGLLQRDELWSAVEIIADQLVSRPNHRLMGTEIESLLVSIKFKPL